MDQMREHSTRGDAATVGAASGLEDVRDGLAGMDPALLSDPDRIALVAELGTGGGSGGPGAADGGVRCRHGIPTDADTPSSGVVGAEAGLAQRAATRATMRHALVLAQDQNRSWQPSNGLRSPRWPAAWPRRPVCLIGRNGASSTSACRGPAPAAVRSARQACQRITAEIDADAVARRMRRAKTQRR